MPNADWEGGTWLFPLLPSHNILLPHISPTNQSPTPPTPHMHTHPSLMVVEIAHATSLFSVAFYGALIACLLNVKAIQVWIWWGRNQLGILMVDNYPTLWVYDGHPLLGVYVGCVGGKECYAEVVPRVVLYVFYSVCCYHCICIALPLHLYCKCPWGLEMARDHTD